MYFKIQSVAQIRPGLQAARARAARREGGAAARARAARGEREERRPVRAPRGERGRSGRPAVQVVAPAGEVREGAQAGGARAVRREGNHWPRAGQRGALGQMVRVGRGFVARGPAADGARRGWGDLRLCRERGTRRSRRRRDWRRGCPAAGARSRVGVQRLHRLSGPFGAFLFRTNIVAISSDIDANQRIWICRV